MKFQDYTCPTKILSIPRLVSSAFVNRQDTYNTGPIPRQVRDNRKFFISATEEIHKKTLAQLFESIAVS